MISRSSKSSSLKPKSLKCMSIRNTNTLAVATSDKGTIRWKFLSEVTVESSIKQKAEGIIGQLMTCMMPALMVSPELGHTLLDALESDLGAIQRSQIQILFASQSKFSRKHG